MSKDPPGPEDQTNLTESGTPVQEEPRVEVPYLLVLTGLGAGNIFRLQGEMTIGREADAQIRLLDIDVSRKHARVTASGSDVVIEDGGSRNGTKVNGQRLIAPRALADGDTIDIASATALKFTLHDGADQKFESAIQERARRDDMTGAYKWQYFELQLASEIAYARRHKSPLSVLMIDVDKLAALNEEWGRVLGDMVLARVARRIARHLRAEDLLARFGGGTFAIVCRQTDAQQAVALAERLRKRVCHEPYEVVGDAILLSVSIGIGSLRAADLVQPTDLVAAATSALKKAKTSGAKVVVADT
jgi:two-component system cell cycle response regulator